MNNFPTLPTGCAAFDLGSKPVLPAEPTQPAADDFSSMLASVWFGPGMSQAPNLEVTVESEMPEPPISVIEEAPADKVLLPLSTIPSTEIPEIPILESEKSITDKLTVELPTPKVEVSQPTNQANLDAKSAQPVPVVNEEKPVEVPVATTPGINEAPAQNVAWQRDPEPFPDGVKTITPVRRPPTFNIDPPGKPRTPEVKPVESPIAEVIIESVKPEKVVTSETASDEPTVAKTQPTDQVTAEAIRREANLVASYLAQSTRDSRENPMESIKAQVSGNGPETKSNDTLGEAKSQSSTATNMTSPVFATALKNQTTEATAEVIGSQVTRQIVELADVTPQRQTRSVRIRLRPEELGQVDVQLSRDSAGKVSAQMLVESESTRAALSQSLHQLRETLERAGLTVDRLQVSADASTFAGSARDSNRQSSEDNPRPSFGQSESSTINETQTKERVRDHKLLSLSA